MAHSLPLFSFVSLLGLLATGQCVAQSGPYASTQSTPVANVEPAAVYPDSVYVNPEVRPQFAGGDKAFSAYLSKSLRYPPQALQRRISGRVMVNFVLNAEGKVQDAHVISGPGNGLNDEALRLVWLMPPWEPARVNGQPVRVACTVPITFNSDR
ncbi:energy transducer TonB [Hymenobacter arizonensis]|uniref:Protein TonB n=1 Tax=Hymenobacter arizonensis TaxID=1227077 RepID=A0A1I5ZUG0_HYMAR|nr:energy transducer TonB [Hymenobacter arizonensis]SFQ60068.1 protein TonB [Hymenobacter arizonensis]